jgi:hypothetical protein
MVLHRNLAFRHHVTEDVSCISMEVAMTFTLRVPESENPHLRSEAVVVSRHESLGAARFAFLRHQIVAQRQGYRSEAFIWDEERGRPMEGSGSA